MKGQTQNVHVRITAKQKAFELNLKEVWQYRDLIMLFAKTKFELAYKQTVLGPLWAFINPLLTSVVFSVVFGYIARIDTAGVPHILFYLCSNALWQFFAGCVDENALTFTSNADLFGKVYFPRLTVPVSAMLARIFKYVLQMSAALFVLFFYVIKGAVHPLWPCWLLLPVILVWLGIMGSSVGVIVSSLTTKYRDLVMLVGFGVMLWMYVSPVVYPVSQLEQRAYAGLIMLNPVTAPIELFRRILLGSGQVMVGGLIYSAVLTTVMALAAVVIFNRVEKTFMDTV